MTTKQTTFLREIAFKHHPNYMNSSIGFQRELLSIVNSSPKSIDVENIVEIAMAYRGGYDFIDAKAMDYNDDDESDSKTSSINPRTRTVEIGNIGNKIGALRLSIWNPILDVVDYMFLPFAVWKYKMANKCYGKNTENKLRLQMTWNEKKNHYNSYEPFRLNGFVELATMSEDKFYLLHPEFVQYRQIESSIALQVAHYSGLTKIDPNLQTPSPYNSGTDSQQILNSEGTQSTSLSEKS